MTHELSNLNVYYGWSKLNKIRKKIALSVVFDNGGGTTDRGMNTLKRLQNTCYIRKQTLEEAKDGKHHNRIFLEYSLFLNDKHFSGDLEKLLDCNYQKDINNVPADELERIKIALRNGFKTTYKDLKL